MPGDVGGPVRQPVKDEEPTQRWPAWARYLGLVVIVVAAVIAVALLPGVGVRTAQFRIAVVIGLIVLMMPVQMWGIRRRVRRLERRLEGELAACARTAGASWASRSPLHRKLVACARTSRTLAKLAGSR